MLLLQQIFVLNFPKQYLKLCSCCPMPFSSTNSVLKYKPEGNQGGQVPFCKTVATAGTRSSLELILEVHSKTGNFWY